jgi:hypothetical protein
MHTFLRLRFKMPALRKPGALIFPAGLCSAARIRVDKIFVLLFIRACRLAGTGKVEKTHLSASFGVFHPTIPEIDARRVAAPKNYCKVNE